MEIHLGKGFLDADGSVFFHALYYMSNGYALQLIQSEAGMSYFLTKFQTHALSI